jgi:hypothetical protein
LTFSSVVVGEYSEKFLRYVRVHTQFRVNDFHLWQADSTLYGGGLVAYARPDLACDRKLNFEFQNVESISNELSIDNKKWLISGLYRPPSLSKTEFDKDCIKTFDKITTIMNISYYWVI